MRGCNGWTNERQCATIGSVLNEVCFWEGENCVRQREICRDWDDDYEMCVIKNSSRSGSCFTYNITNEGGSTDIKCFEQKSTCGDWAMDVENCVRNNSISTPYVTCEVRSSVCVMKEVEVAPISQSSANGGTVAAIVLCVIFGILAVGLVIFILIYIFKDKIKKKKKEEEMDEYVSGGENVEEEENKGEIYKENGEEYNKDIADDVYGEETGENENDGVEENEKNEEQVEETGGEDEKDGGNGGDYNGDGDKDGEDGGDEKGDYFDY
jgi:uncharacterized membrane protein